MAGLCTPASHLFTDLHSSRAAANADIPRGDHQRDGYRPMGAYGAVPLAAMGAL